MSAHERVCESVTHEWALPHALVRVCGSEAGEGMQCRDVVGYQLGHTGVRAGNCREDCMCVIVRSRSRLCRRSALAWSILHYHHKWRLGIVRICRHGANNSFGTYQHRTCQQSSGVRKEGITTSSYTASCISTKVLEQGCRTTRVSSHVVG
jgi:hypothetical protein